MSRDGNGSYSLPEAAFVYDTVISETAVNNNFSDIASALTASIAKDGQTVPTANLPMGTYRHTGVGNAVARTDYAAAGQVQDSAFHWCGTAGGTADAITLTPSPAITAYAAGQVFRFKAGASPSTSSTPTIAVSGLSAITVQTDGSALASGDIAASKWYEALYDGANFQLRRWRLGGTGTVTNSGGSTAGHIPKYSDTSGVVLTDGYAIGADIQAYDADTLKSDTTRTLTAGYSATPYNAGTKSSGTFTPDEANGNQQYCTNGGAFTMAPPTNCTSIVLEITNNGSAGAVTTSGFTKVTGSFTTTNGHKFICNIVKTQSYSLLQIQALQ